MKSIVFTLLTLMISTTYAKELKTRVAVIDTGFSGLYATVKTQAALCEDGHFDFTMNSPNLGFDAMGHGTFVTNLIVENAERDDICIMVYKVHEFVNEPTRNHIGSAIKYAYKRGARLVNISMGDPTFSHREEKIVKAATKGGMKIFTSAGNSGKDMNQECSSFPACYKVSKNLYRVGSTDASGLLETYSNRGSIVDIYEYGSIVGIGRGTSFASPRALARHLREKNLEK